MGRSQVGGHVPLINSMPSVFIERTQFNHRTSISSYPRIEMTATDTQTFWEGLLCWCDMSRSFQRSQTCIYLSLSSNWEGRVNSPLGQLFQARVADGVQEPRAEFAVSSHSEKASWKHQARPSGAYRVLTPGKGPMQAFKALQKDFYRVLFIFSVSYRTSRVYVLLKVSKCRS